MTIDKYIIAANKQIQHINDRKQKGHGPIFWMANIKKSGRKH